MIFSELGCLKLAIATKCCSDGPRDFQVPWAIRGILSTLSPLKCYDSSLAATSYFLK